ncbi:TonB-dependent receptor plug domain-containing protein [Plebeiibacterium marinum]|uniref:TonB-dependent receptor n=1 Tax=Plebeiibacterium marinum TaxID=2992111 RepID=A0AAE3SM24_9BACT|nr:TonB-dependent receptor [Plebeiobacterium marinum]MCW3808044.1 TonB-dependent receptor [Plebeiobacterium marinum]
MLKQYIALALMLVFSFSLYAQETKKDVNKLSRDEVLEMTIEDLSNYDLEEIMKIMDIVGASTIEELYELLLNKDVTSASKSEESLFDSPLSTTVLSHDQILASGATCFEEALRMVPGVIVREKTNGNFDVHIRGNDNLPAKNMMLYSENSQTLVMINSRPVFNYSHGGTLWESLPVSFEDVDRIEVVRGPSSALYGPNAVSGVINIITADITKETPLVSGNVKAGNLNSYIGDIAFRKQINDKFGFGVTANYETRDRENDKIYVYNGLTQNTTTGEYEPKYRLDSQPTANGYYSMDEIRRLYVVDGENTYKVFPEKGETGTFDNGEIITIYGPDDIFLHPENAKERYAVNGYVELSPNKSTNINITGGYQHSDVLTSTMGDMPTPYSGKISKTGYIDLRASIKDFSFQANYNGGDIDFMTGNEGFELDLHQYNATAEYNLKLNKIAIRPGLNYQHISYDDSPYILSEGRGYLNGQKDIEIMAGSLRLDYKPTDNLRLIAALRTEKYNHPDDFYTSWQFVGSYKLNDNHIFRAVYSRANQSSFLVNAHSNYTWNLINRSFPKIMQFNGNKEYDLLTTDMFELGYRIRPAKNILVDLEAFYNTSNNFGALMPSNTSLAVFNPFDVINGVALPDVNAHVTMEYQNTDLKSKQKGLSMSIDWVISEKLIANAHFTYQQTKLDNYNKVSRDEVIAHQAGTLMYDPDLENKISIAMNNYGAGVLGGTIDPTQVEYVIATTTSNYPTNIKNDYEHKSTPSYFGGFSLTYRPIEKLEILPNAYFYGDQTFENQYGAIDIDSKFIFNTTVNYKATDKLTLSLSGKNLLGNDSQEFAYMDNIPTMVYIGASFKF